MTVTKSSIKRLEKLVSARIGTPPPPICFEDFETKRISFAGKVYASLGDIARIIDVEKAWIFTTYGENDPLLPPNIRYGL